MGLPSHKLGRPSNLSSLRPPSGRYRDLWGNIVEIGGKGTGQPSGEARPVEADEPLSEPELDEEEAEGTQEKERRKNEVRFAVISSGAL